MKESELREYVRKEIILQESVPGDLQYSDMKELFDSFKNVFTVAGIALKAIASSLVLNVEVFFETDASKLKGYFDSYDNRLGRINSEYKSALAKADELISDFSPILFITNPAAYAAFQIADSYADNFADTRDFLRDIGIESSTSSMGRGDEKDLLGRLLDFLTGKTTKSGEGIARTLKKQMAIRNQLNRLFGSSFNEAKDTQPSSLNESLEDKKSKMNLADEMTVFFKTKMPKIPPEGFGISKESSAEVISLKKQEAETFAKILESPLEFLRILQSAKTLEEVKRAVVTLKSTPFVVRGIEEITQEKITKSAQSAIAEAKKKGKMEDLLKMIGAKEKPKSEEMLVELVKAYQLRNILGQAVVKSSSELSKQIEKMRVEFLKKFEEDCSLKLVTKVAPSSDLEAVMKNGIEKIRNAGKR